MSWRKHNDLKKRSVRDDVWGSGDMALLIRTSVLIGLEARWTAEPVKQLLLLPGIEPQFYGHLFRNLTITNNSSINNDDHNNNNNNNNNKVTKAIPITGSEGL
jgi:hypothetical protein